MLNRMPKVGDHVNCPADRGDAPYDGIIKHVAPTINTNIDGIKYVWCSVHKIGSNSRHTWPSHRLGYTIKE